MHFPNLFSQVRINKLTLKNRIVMTAMHLGYTPQGEVTDRLVEFYAARAIGGVALIIVGGCVIDEHGGMASMIRISDDSSIPGLARLVRSVKKRGAKIAAQLYQAGRYAHSSMIGGRKPFSASAVRSRLTGETPRALELEEIPQVQDKFSLAALRAKKAGFDAIEILGSAGYLISQFLSPITNLRRDRYGGSLENRMRFGIEVAEKVRNIVGPEYPVIMRLAGNDFMPGGNSNKEARIFAAELEKAGIDTFNVTGGWHETRIPQLSTFVPPGAFVYLARGIRSAVSVPVIASNRINDPHVAEAILREGSADMVTMARALIADPNLPHKAMEGKEEQIYHCIACNQGCFDNIFRLKPVECMVNPVAGLESEIKISRTSRKKSVLVIGGGPAGMKAACTAAERGNSVTIVEKNNRLGGQLLLNAMIPGRKELVRAATDLVNNVKALGVNILLNREADRKLVGDMAPDVVILATGAVPLIPQIPGIGKRSVIHAWDLLSGREKAGKRVVVVGGNAVGLETALYLAHQGTISPEVLFFLMANRAESQDTIQNLLKKGNKDITVLEMREKAGQDIGSSTRWTVMAELKRLGVKLMTGTEAKEITQEGLLIERAGKSSLLAADSVVVAAGARPLNGLKKELEDLVPQIHVVGDAVEPRNALLAIKEGFFAGLKV